MPKPPQFEGGGLSEREGPGRFKTTAEKRTDEALVRVSETLEGASVTEEEAREIFGDTFFGSNEVEEAFGPLVLSIPIPFTRQELLDAKGQGATLLLQIASHDIGPRVDVGDSALVPLTLGELKRYSGRKGGENMWQPKSTLGAFAGIETPREGWKLIYPNFIAAKMNMLQQIEELSIEVPYYFFSSDEKPLPPEIAEAQKQDKWPGLDQLSDEVLAEELEGLKATKVFMEPAVEILYHAVLLGKVRGDALSSDHVRLRTNTRNGDSFLEVCSDRHGLYIEKSRPSVGSDSLYVRVTRMG